MLKGLLVKVYWFFSTVRHAFDFERRASTAEEELLFLGENIRQGRLLETDRVDVCEKCAAAKVAGAAYCWKCGHTFQGD